MSTLFKPFDLAGTPLANRVVMAPMTRARALEDIPDEHTVLYYAQRASAGLIISEGIPISREGCGYLFNPGLYSDEQAKAWRLVTDAVHAKGGRSREAETIIGHQAQSIDHREVFCASLQGH